MNLYLVTQSERTGWDAFEGFVCAATDEPEARQTHPYGSWNDDAWGGWASKPKYVKVTLIGRAEANIKAGIILKAFHAG